MITWIDVKDRMPEVEKESLCPKMHYLVLMKANNQYIMGIATYYDSSRYSHDQIGPRWHPINYDGLYVYGYRIGGLVCSDDICACDVDQKDCGRDCIPVVVTHWSPIEWQDPEQKGLQEMRSEDRISISQTLPEPIKQTFAPHLLKDPYCKCPECEKANEWHKEVTADMLKEVFGEE